MSLIYLIVTYFADFCDVKKIAKLKTHENLFLTFFIVFFLSLKRIFWPNRKI